MRKLLLYSFLFICKGLQAQGPYAPQAGSTGSTALHKDTSAFIAWVNEATINRGKQNIEDAASDTTSVGNRQSSLGSADGNIVSLGDGGSAILQFEGNIYNGPGYDFAVFENAFNHTFLELAHVEVSSDGVHFFRFPSHSLTDTLQPVGSFGAVDPTMVHNLAGKYRANYGTPFDLEDLRDTPGLDIQNISHVKVIDVVGSLNPAYASRDSEGRKINDQYPTAFPSGGFDLDAVGVIYLKTVGLSENNIFPVQVYPNPASEFVYINREWLGGEYHLSDLQGKTVSSNSAITTETLSLPDGLRGIYFLMVQKNDRQARTKIIIQ